ncbi:MAG: BatD family protein [Flavobacteriaceae bacterium]
MKCKNRMMGNGTWAIVCAIFLTITYSFSQEVPSISSRVDTTQIKIGEQLRFTVTIETDTTAQVIFPEGQTFSPLETVESFATDTTRKKDRMTLEKVYALTQFDSGAYKLPAQRIEINGKGYFTDSLMVQVATVPVDTLVQKMYDIKPLLEVERSQGNFWKILLGALLFLSVLGFLLYWFVFRAKRLTEAEKEALLPPYDRALLELKKLENSKYLIQDEYKQYYSELTDIVRSYLEEDVHVSALESTSEELITKLEMMRDAGELQLESDTIGQFKRILQTADLVKFAKSKPPTSVAEQDRKSIEEIVIKTKKALPEPSEEDLMQREEYLEGLAKKEKRKKWILAGSISSAAVMAAIAFSLVYFGPRYVWDTITGYPTKKLLEGEWIASSYGYPPINLETPDVLVRQKAKPAQGADENIKEMQSFSYESPDGLFTINATSITLAQQVEPNYEQAVESFLKSLESKGAKNIITKQEEFVTVTGIRGLKTYGSGKFSVPEKAGPVNGNYIVLNFGGPGFQQQITLTWLVDDPYAQEIVDRILRTVEVKTEV